jgi:DNA-binding transcriptional LysR family regulator
MKPDFRSLEVFYWVAQLGSFRRAAERMNTTQPAVSQRVASLELDLHVKLLERGPRAATLTPKGRELRDYVERMLRLMAEMTEAVASPAAMSGVVRLGVSETLVHTWLPLFIERVHAIHPNVTLDIEVDVSPNLRNAVVENRMDLGFLLGPVSEPSMLNFELCAYPLAFVASPDLDLGPTGPDGRYPIETLMGKPIITYPTTTRPYIVLRQLLARRSVATPRIYSNSSLSTIVRMTVDRIGVSVIPPAVIGPELARGELRVIDTDISLPDLAFTATTPMTPDGSPAEPLARLAQEIARQYEAGEV